MGFWILNVVGFPHFSKNFELCDSFQLIAGEIMLLFARNWQTRSKRFLEIQKLRENKQEYDLKTAISLVKQSASTKFVETVEAHFRLNIDPKYNDQQLRATVSFLNIVWSIKSEYPHSCQLIMNDAMFLFLK